CPRYSWNFELMARPTMSDEPPATNGMMTLMGLLGNCWACAGSAQMSAPRARMRFMFSLLLLFFGMGSLGTPVGSVQFGDALRLIRSPNDSCANYRLDGPSPALTIPVRTQIPEETNNETVQRTCRCCCRGRFARRDAGERPAVPQQADPHHRALRRG